MTALFWLMILLNKFQDYDSHVELIKLFYDGYNNVSLGGFRYVHKFLFNMEISWVNM